MCPTCGRCKDRDGPLTLPSPAGVFCLRPNLMIWGLWPLIQEGETKICNLRCNLDCIYCHNLAGHYLVPLPRWLKCFFGFTNLRILIIKVKGIKLKRCLLTHSGVFCKTCTFSVKKREYYKHNFVQQLPASNIFSKSFFFVWARCKMRKFCRDPALTLQLLQRWRPPAGPDLFY